ncbi:MULTISPECIES: aspartate-semialdehyde dehydrogenase [Sphingobacterium]|jgi:aspartate-semialdehyde dehydrogenase|uniref:Aspartate-semialdehyde dehydrogenase n=2 Tax=Sphingobacterium TaxID=28453 RepID=A0ABW5Z1A9_9SPHI|nr:MULTISPECIES: aspartate-semialdehyde dehydrogenase [Sphingobacterium]KKX46762.1 aspartate-semialdehyde dehydrogenase [Sphingobacterium sp. IITKGP-BTPF85]MBB2954258.1 aspartate-semialdehyde dehydrogenase [Sphingobacterium sp. JUb56]MCS3555733.1 aspartate-semialdehyde dehydrogenase [Sphingobacterium sp. JUb21]MCW2261980.1 aspartate-semialdehyde dehydrogenase [Sphingobacterium kitahiroshimense]NJI75061.1 aspartate-semialdehyde dehydrogenase [Sphingobacterium sp. B16(2022)]
MKVAVVGATGLVGTEMLTVLAARNFPVSELIPVASERSKGKEIDFKGKKYKVVTPSEAIALKPDVALFSAGGGTSLEYAPLFAAAGITVIDNSSAWRMDPTKKLVVPEVNGDVLTAEDKIIANPNCSTIQMVVALKPLHDKYKIKRVVVSTYQSVTGTGVKAVEQLMNERAGIKDGEKAYAYEIDLNVIPQIDVFQENGYTKEEMKMILETNKIMGDDSIKVTATTVRIPVMGGHSESLNIEFERDFDLADVREALAAQSGVIVVDDPANLQYPMPKDAHGRDEVFVGRIRRDDSQANTLNMWVVADNLRKGAATNTIQIAETLREKGLI